MFSRKARAIPRPLTRALTVLSGGALVASMLLTTVGIVAAAAGPSADLDQCRNGGLVKTGLQTSIQCAGNGSGSSGWVNGNAGASNAHYAEGESISYRARLSGLHNNDQVTLIMGYDVVHGGVHAIDYLTDKNRWQTPETTVAAKPDLPCSTVTGCSGTNTAPIPAPITNVQVDPSKTLANGCEIAGNGATQQPVTSFNGIPAASRVMEFFNATPAATNAIQYVGPTPDLLDRNGDQEQQISVTFKANSATPTLAWGGHIASRLDWGCSGAPQSASGISGSPYHMRIKDIIVNGAEISLGNQDRSLSAAAVIFVNPGISTTPNPSSGSIGALLNDSATLSGALSPTGSITFKLFPPSDATCAGTPVLTQIVALTGNSASTTPGYTSLVAGIYRWTADYPGDGQNAAASSGCQAEQVTIAKAGPTLGTTPTPSTGSIGALLNDSATLSGASNPTGSIAFKLFPPSDATCAGTAVYSQSVTLTGNSAQTSPGYTSLVAGTYRWTADYAGDDNNDSASSGCQAEQVTIGKNSPSAATAQNLIPNDTFTLSGGASATGSVTFYLFDKNGSCNAAGTGAVYSQTVALSGGTTAATTNTGSGVGMYKATLEGTYTWYVSYGGDSNNNAAVSNCVETFAIDN
jgi:hypothetical protein